MKIMKKFCAAALTLTLAFCLPMALAAHSAEPPSSIMIDGLPVHFYSQEPVVVSDIMLVPVRGVFEQLGFAVYWYREHQQVVLRSENYVIVLTTGSDVFYTNGIGHRLDVPMQLIRGTAMLPVLAVLESAGFGVEWDLEARAVLITSEAVDVEPEGEIPPGPPECDEQPIEPDPLYETEEPEEQEEQKEYEETEYEPTGELPMQDLIGEIMRFGGYDWRVLDVKDSMALVISERIILSRKYHHTFETVTWETSELRGYLNGEFLERFSPEDQERIAVTTVANNDNPWFGTNGGNDTTDRVFLLSIEEAVRFFGDSGELNSPLDRFVIRGYSQYRMARTIEGALAGWWLRSPGHIPMSAAFVRIDGGIIVPGAAVEDSMFNNHVRPALWLYL